MNLAELKKTGMTIVCTIHQPSEEIMALFDKVIVLSDGHIIYQETSPYEIQSHLDSMNFHKQSTESPMVLKIVDKDNVIVNLMELNDTIDDEKIDRIYQDRVKLFLKRYNQKSLDSLINNTIMKDSYKSLKELAQSKNQHINFFKQCWYLFSYYYDLFCNLWRGIFIKIAMGSIAYIFFVVVFFNVRNRNLSALVQNQNKAGIVSS